MPATRSLLGMARLTHTNCLNGELTDSCSTRAFAGAKPRSFATRENWQLADLDPIGDSGLFGSWVSHLSAGLCCFKHSLTAPCCPLHQSPHGFPDAGQIPGLSLASPLPSALLLPPSPPWQLAPPFSPPPNPTSCVSETLLEH